MSRLAFVSVAVLAVGCATPPRDAPPAGGAERPGTPLKVRWEELARTANGARLMAHVERLAPMPMTLQVRLELPSGAKLTQGRQSFELAANGAYDEAKEEVVLAFDALPEQDLVLHADAESKVAGFHGAAVYRFGRAEPRQEAVPASGDHVIFNGRDLGPSVPLDGKK